MNTKWPVTSYFDYLDIPETWETLEQFADWYMANKMPMRIPVDSFVFANDNASAITIFRHKNFQVELYLGFPNTTNDTHFHPGMEVITVQVGRMNIGTVWGGYTEPLLDGESHSLDFSSNLGCAFLTFEKWKPGKRLTSAMVNWKGKTAGPKHDALIKLWYPDAILEDGYADVTLDPR